VAEKLLNCSGFGSEAAKTRAKEEGFFLASKHITEYVVQVRQKG
jgi:hypothetical protein